MGERFSADDSNMNEMSHSHTMSYVGICRAQSDTISVVKRDRVHFCCYKNKPIGASPGRDNMVLMMVLQII